MKKIILMTLLVILSGGFSVSLQGKEIEPVKKDVLGQHNGDEVLLFTLKNKGGNVLKLTNYGARIVRIEVPDKNGVRDNICLGSEMLDGILKDDQYGLSLIHIS